MKPITTLFLACVCLPAAWAASTIPGNADRGAEVFREKQCIGCHAVNGDSGTSAPDLTKSAGGRFTPTILARAIWNHGPKMWATMEKAGLEKSSLNQQDAADLFAYLYRFRHFEDPGDADQGRQAFDAKGCIACHSQGTAGAPPVMEWESLNNPIQLAVADLFEIVLELKPEGKNIRLKALKGAMKVAEHPTLVLDPSTLLMRDSA